MRQQAAPGYPVSARTRTDWILWGALGCALVGTAHSEWSLAVAVGAHPWIAAAVPGALDLYVIRALQVRRDVFVAVLAMVAANVAWYLVHSQDLPVDWPLRSAVGAVAPLVVWRVHSLKYTRTRKELLWGTRSGAVSAPVPGDAPEAGTPVPVDMTNWTPGYHLDGCDGVHALEGPFHCQMRSAELEGPVPVAGQAPGTSPAHDPGCGLTHPDDGPCSEYGYPPVPDAVPADWMAAEYPETYPGAAVLAAQEDEYADKWAAPLHPVPALPDEYAPGTAVHSAVLEERDREYAVPAKEYAAGCAVSGTVPSVRGMRRELSIGQDRAERLLAWLESEET